MKKGDRVQITGGEHVGKTGIIRRLTADGRGFIINMFGPRGGLPQSPAVAASDIRRIATPNTTPDATRKKSGEHAPTLHEGK